MMPPFLQFRLWLRTAPLASKVSAGLALGLVLVLLTWIALPAPDTVEDNLATAGTAGQPGLPVEQGGAPAVPGAAGLDTTAGVPTAPGSGPGAVPGSAGGATGPRATVPGAAGTAPGGGAGEQQAARGTAGASCSKPSGRVKVGITLIDIGSGGASVNGVFGLPDVQQQRRTYDIVVKEANRNGGAGCRTIEPFYQTFNQLDASASARSACLAYREAKVFAVLAGFLPRAQPTCLVDSKIPVIELTSVTERDRRKFYPYYFSLNGTYDQIYRDTVQSSKQAGLFDPSKGFRKIGILYRDCVATTFEVYKKQLEEVGVAVDSFSLGCPNAVQAPPTALQQAVLQFQRNGVTHVTSVQAHSDFGGFTRQAQQQGYKPKYIIADDAFVSVTEAPASAPDNENFAGAVGVTATAVGQPNSSFPKATATAQCDKVLKAAGHPDVYSQPLGFYGAQCNIVAMFKAGMDRAPSYSPEALVLGLQRSKSVPFSYPQGPNDYTKAGTTTAGQFWRRVVYTASCSCWKPQTNNFLRGF